MPERQKRVTLKDVANYCGLSRSLVAFILSNSGYRNSTLENRRKVAEAVKVLNYRPNTAARELRSRKSSIIGVAMPMSGTSFYGNIALELQREIKKRGFTSLFSFWGGDDPEEMHAEAIRALFSRDIAGVISWDASPRFQEERIPAVIYGDGGGLYDSVSPDYEQMIAEALRHLAEFGHRTIGILGMKERNRIFTEQVSKNGLTTRPEWIFELACWSRRPQDAFGQFYRNCGRILPDALICHSDTEAVAVISCAGKLGIEVPRDLSVVALDSSFIVDYFHPALDAFDINLPEIATQLVERLLARIDAPEVPVKSVKILSRLVHRESVGRK